jgi:hypothetical protein
MTNRLGRIEFQRGRGSTEVLRGREYSAKEDVNLGGSGTLDRGCANFAFTEFSEFRRTRRELRGRARRILHYVKLHSERV